MSVHTGEPVVGEEGYVGIDVHRAARICAAGHGGQVLLSATTAALVSGAMPDGVSQVPLGDVRLKDLGEPERVVQLEIDGLPARSRRSASRRRSRSTSASASRRRSRRTSSGSSRRASRAAAAEARDSTTKLAKLAGIGLLLLVLVVAACRRPRAAGRPAAARSALDEREERPRERRVELRVVAVPGDDEALGAERRPRARRRSRRRPDGARPRRRASGRSSAARRSSGISASHGPRSCTSARAPCSSAGGSGEGGSKSEPTEARNARRNASGSSRGPSRQRRGASLRERGDGRVVERDARARRLDHGQRRELGPAPRRCEERDHAAVGVADEVVAGLAAAPRPRRHARSKSIASSSGRSPGTPAARGRRARPSRGRPCAAARARSRGRRRRCRGRARSAECLRDHVTNVADFGFAATEIGCHKLADMLRPDGRRRSTTPHSLATASGLLLGTLGLRDDRRRAHRLGASARRALGLLVGAIVGIPLAVFVVYRVYNAPGYVSARVFATPRPVPGRLAPALAGTVVIVLALPGLRRRRLAAQRLGARRGALGRRPGASPGY